MHVCQVVKCEKEKVKVTYEARPFQKIEAQLDHHIVFIAKDLDCQSVPILAHGPAANIPEPCS